MLRVRVPPSAPSSEAGSNRGVARTAREYSNLRVMRPPSTTVDMHAIACFSNVSSSAPIARLYLRFFEENLIYLLENERLLNYTTVMFDHQCCKFRAVNEHKTCIDTFGIVAPHG